mmetsp:Transcript_54586/g.128960  ORF Transcript_54586/g.128960 Transcript_54586/m.128960 type:complete len:156 (+) Transcript_54586:3-470(+)
MNNTLSNNIFALSTGGLGLLYQAEFQYSSFGASNLTFVSNIVYLDLRAGRVFACPYAGEWFSSSNLYWNASDSSGNPSGTFPSATTRVSPVPDQTCNSTLSTFEQSSKVGDPGFAAPLRGDFRLPEPCGLCNSIGFNSTLTNVALANAGLQPQQA